MLQVKRFQTDHELPAFSTNIDIWNGSFEWSIRFGKHLREFQDFNYMTWFMYFGIAPSENKYGWLSMLSNIVGDLINFLSFYPGWYSSAWWMLLEQHCNNAILSKFQSSFGEWVGKTLISMTILCLLAPSNLYNYI